MFSRQLVAQPSSALPDKPLTRRQRTYVESLAESADMQGARAAAGLSRLDVRVQRERNPNFDLQCHAAEQAVLVDAAWTRGVTGILEPQRFKGQVCGYDRAYSDALLQDLLRAKVPEFANRQQIDVRKQVTNTNNIIVNALTDEQRSAARAALARWEASFKQGQAVDAEFCEPAAVAVEELF